MNNKTKGVIAGIAGLALLGGGTTFALWSDSATVNGGTITSGNLDVAAAGNVVWYDVSDDRADATATTPVTNIAAHAISSIGTWRIVPEDTIEATFPIAVALEGDNLVADLVVTNPTAITGAGGTIDSVAVYDSNNVLVGTAGVGTTSVVLQAPGTGQDNGTDDPGILVVNNTTLTGTPNVTLRVVVTISFDAVNQEDVQTTVADLSTVGVSLTQTRTGVGHFN